MSAFDRALARVTWRDLLTCALAAVGVWAWVWVILFFGQ